jgi:hypothetical protein
MLKMKKITICIVFIIILQLYLVHASDITIEKTASKQEVQPDEWFSINLVITSNFEEPTISFIFEQDLPILEFRDHMPYDDPYNYYMTPYIRLSRTLPVNSFIEEEFFVRISNIGTYHIPETRLNTEDASYTSNPLEITVLCNQNSRCEQSLNENYQNCLSDCQTGSQDGICDKISDGRIDPDCSSGYFDPDYVPDHCSNRIKDNNELGVDCGYICNWDCINGQSPLPTCSDGIQNQGETDIDCGGPCVACPACSDGIQNQGETDIDCGGPCVACPACSDGIQNQDEYWADCGGVCGSCFKSGGTGTQEEPYIITDCYELQYIDTDLISYYELGNDIDCSDTINWNEGNGFDPIGGTFSGVFDGNGYIISNLYIKRQEESRVGLFSTISNIVENLGLEDVNINGRQNVGGITGSLSNTGIIRRVYTTGSVIGDKYVGGLVGGTAGGNPDTNHPWGKVEDSYSIAIRVSGDTAIGGLVGNNYGEIRNSYSLGNIIENGGRLPGGLAGINWGPSALIVNSFTINSIIADQNGDLGRITNSYYTGSGNCVRTDYPGESYYGTTECYSKDLNWFYNKNNQPLSNWDFTNIWQEQVNDYPILSWQVGPGVLSQAGISSGDSDSGGGGGATSSGGSGSSTEKQQDSEASSGEESQGPSEMNQILPSIQEFFTEEENKKMIYIVAGSIIFLLIIAFLLVIISAKKRASKEKDSIKKTANGLSQTVSSKRLY